MSRQTALWALAALLGLVLTAGITWATSQLTSQHIGLSSEPVSGRRRLAPAVTEATTPRRTTTRKRTTAHPRKTSSGSTVATPSEPTVSQVTPAPVPSTTTSSSGSVRTSGSATAKRTTPRRRTGASRDDSGGDGGKREASGTGETGTNVGETGTGVEPGTPVGSAGEGATGSSQPSSTHHRDD